MGVEPLDGPRAVRPEELSATLELIDSVFSPDRRDMGRRFPRIFHEDNRENCRVILDRGQPVAHVVYLPRDAAIGGPTIRTACIGAVCTAPSHRGRGLASALLDDCERRLRAAGADVMLISGARGLYLRRGARTVGRIHRYELGPDRLRPLARPGLDIRRAGPDDAAALAALYAARPVHFERTASDWAAWLEAGRCENFRATPWLAFDGGTVAAYLAHSDRGHKGEPISRASEWAGEPGAVATLLARAARRSELGLVEIRIDPVADRPLAVLFARADLPHEVTHNSRTVKVLRPSALFDKVRPHLAGPAGEVAVEDVDEGARLRLSSETLTLGVDEVARVIFGDPGGEVSAKLGNAGALGEALAGRLPFPLPRYGYNYT
jgi:predicted N-acetyltransferase YhbS